MGEILKDIEQKSLVEKIIDLETYTETALTQSNYVKNQRFLLCADIRKAISDILHYAIRAMKKYHKKTTLQDMDIEIEYLRWLIRISHKKKYITNHRLDIWMMKLNEIGAMVGGWIKHENSRT